ncbi:uncharacterized protein LOC131604663 [Vicia villosa]|uniref:uncharacterized protein LOC131604663 n=1 Tax=Vicia villosa TaxID=3911 RepID=UPI00273BC200|nr:uncharacterized protein LOC131604663 [Vicia villosa]
MLRVLYRSIYFNFYQVQWNDTRQPKGTKSAAFASYIGCITRRFVPITVENWRSKDDILKTYKQNIWDEIQKAYVIGDERRNFIISEAGKLFRAFKVKLRIKYLKDKDGNVNKKPPEKYSYITQEQWDKFVAHCTSDDFQKLSSENRKRALNPLYPYRKSRLGYARLEEEMKQKSNEERIPRFELWKAARVNKDGDIDNDNVQKIVDKCEALTQSLTEEERGEDLGRNDILFQALDLPEYSGRVRSYGFGVSAKDIFPRQAPPTQAHIDKIYLMFNTLTKRLETLESEKLEREKKERTQADEISERHESEKVVERQQSKEVGRMRSIDEIVERKQAEEVGGRRSPDKVVETRHPSDKDSCNPGAVDSIPKGISSINMYLSSPNRHLVARGKLYNIGSDVVHGIKLLPGYVKVMIEVPIVSDAPLPISVEYGDVSMVGQAIGTIVPWPFKLVDFVNECQKIPRKFQRKDKNVQYSAESIASPIKNSENPKIQELPSKVGGSTSSSTLQFLDMYVKMMMKPESVIEITMEKNIFGEEFQEHVHVENIKELIDHKWLSATVITIYVRYLYDKFITPNGLVNKFSFISPYVSSDDKEGKNIAKLLLINKEFKERMILAPYNFGNHWVLLVINLNAEIIYYMNSVNVEHDNYHDLKMKFEK